MIISLIVAMDEARGIGRKGGLPWHLSDDLKRFKRITMGHYLVMGRKTFESIGRPLPGRTIVIITRNKSFKSEEYLVTHSLDDAFALALARGETEVFVTGGGVVFSQALPFAERIYLTRVHAHTECDVFFPDFLPDAWVEKEREFHPADGHNDYPSTYSLLEKKSHPD